MRHQLGQIAVRAAVAGGLALLVMLGLAVPAEAGLAVGDGGLLLLGGDNFGEKDTISLTASGGMLSLSDTGVLASHVTTTSGSCSKSSATINCTAFGFTGVLMYVQAGDDKVTPSFFPLPVTVSGQGGDDTLFGTQLDDDFSGGPGDDIIASGPGDDMIRDAGASVDDAGGDDIFTGNEGDDTIDAGIDPGGAPNSGSGADRLFGAEDTDTVDYGARTTPLNVTVAANVLPAGQNGNDGAAGEQDDVAAIEHVIGGSAGDTLTAYDASSTLEGGPGADFLNGGAGGDELIGGRAGSSDASGADTLDGGGGGDVLDGSDGIDLATYAARSTAVTVSIDDRANDGSAGEGDNVLPSTENVTGGSGNDRISGDQDANVLRGGLGNDTLSSLGGADLLDGAGGNDTIAARDGAVTTVQCGAGADTVAADSEDTVAADCEQVTRYGPVAVDDDGPALTLPAKLKSDRHGRVAVTLGCPAGEKPGCLFGTATLASVKHGKSHKLAAPQQFSARGGSSAKLSFRLKRSAVRKLKHKPHKLRVVLSAAAEDAAGNTATTSAKLKLRRGH